MEQDIIFITIIGMALVTYVPRIFPLLALSGKKLPDFVVAWLKQVPAAVLAAMLLPSILMPSGQVTVGFDNLFFWAALPTLGAAILTKSLFVPVIVGMVLVILGRIFIG